jgi:ketosteroid isomerase-like protein
MSPQDIKTVLTKMQEDTCKGNLDAIYQYIADGYVFHRIPLPDTVGKEANRKGDEAMLAAFTNNRMTIHEIVVEGNMAVMHYTW